MADYSQYDDTSLERMLADAVDYEQRSAIRQEIRKRKKQRGQQVGRPKKGASGYNRFAGSTAPAERPPPKNYIYQGDESQPPEKPRSTTPSKKPEPVQSPVVRPTTPTPPSTPEQATQPTTGVDEPDDDIPPHEDEEAPISPPPSPDPPAEPIESVDGVPNVELGEEGNESEPRPPLDDLAAPTEDSTVLVEDDCPSSPKDRDETDYSKRSSGETEHKSTIKSSTEPRTLADYQRLTARSKVKTENQSEGTTPISTDELQKYLVAYVNQELNISPPMPARGKSLFDTCSDPANLCKLINKSVRNTVDLRALTRISASMSAGQRAEALQDNMTLVIESARAIGCHIEDDSIDKILEKNPQTITAFLVDLIRARVVHLPGMEDEPSSTFSNMAILFNKLGISVVDDTDTGAPPSTEDSWKEDREKVRKGLGSPSPASGDISSPSPTGEMTYEERAAQRKAQREQRQKETDSAGESSELSYEERAAQRKAERERRRKEREALAK